MVREDELDATLFARLVAQATATDAKRASMLLERALDLWRGDAYEDVRESLPIANEARRLDEERLRVQTWHARLQLELGRHAELIPHLTKLIDEHPYQEDLRGHLMVALYRSGRRADALDLFRMTRRLFREELGVEPTPELQRLHESILQAGVAQAPAQPVTPDIPRQLPRDLAGFTGRADQLRMLDATLPSLTPTVITAIAGSAGVGKTALAVHWAHKVADRFPDGQLYVNLRGFDAVGTPMSPSEALRRFLDALGATPTRIPTDLEAQTALYRSLVADKRILLVLDNAQSAEQVRPLLPGSASCLVLVTSRNRLAGLVVTTGARPLFLDVLAPEESREFLAARVGKHRVSVEREAVEEIIARCASLPLALAIAAAQATLNPEQPLAVLAEQLRSAYNALDAFGSVDDQLTDLRAVFSWSVLQLSPATARLFQLLGAHPGPDISAAAVASLAGLSSEAAQLLLTELVDAHLLSEHSPDRYMFHDLLRAYASELQLAHAAEVDTALQRLLDHYLHTAYGANRLLEPMRNPISLDSPVPGVMPEDLTGAGAAMGWLTAEHHVLTAMIRYSAKAGFAVHTWKLAWCLSTFLDWQGHWTDLTEVHELSLDVTKASADPEGVAYAHHGLARAHVSLGHFDNAETHLRLALQLRSDIGDIIGQANAHMALCLVKHRQDRIPDALTHSQEAYVLFKQANHKVGQAAALNSLGWFHVQAGDYERGLAYAERALSVFQELGDRQAQADVWHSIGYARRGNGQLRKAIECFRNAAGLYFSIGHRYHEAGALNQLGDTLRRNNDEKAARKAWRRALGILSDLGHPDAEEVRSKLGDQ